MDSGVLSATPVHACTGFQKYRYTLVKGVAVFVISTSCRVDKLPGAYT